MSEVIIAPVATGMFPRFAAVLNPYDGSEIGRVPQHDAADVERVLERARLGFTLSSSLSRYQRHAALERASVLAARAIRCRGRPHRA